MELPVVVSIILGIISIIVLFMYISSKSSYNSKLDGLQETIEEARQEINDMNNTIDSQVDELSNMQITLGNTTQEKNTCKETLKDTRDSLSTQTNRVISMTKELSNKTSEINKLNDNYELCINRSEEEINELNLQKRDLYDPSVFRVYDLTLQQDIPIGSPEIISIGNELLDFLKGQITAEPNTQAIRTFVEENHNTIIAAIERVNNNPDSEYPTLIMKCLAELIFDNRNSHNDYIDFIVEFLLKLKTDDNFALQENDSDTINTIKNTLYDTPICIPIKAILYYAKKMENGFNPSREMIIYPIVCGIGKKMFTVLLNQITQLNMLNNFPNIDNIKSKLLDDVNTICNCSENQ